MARKKLRGVLKVLVFFSAALLFGGSLAAQNQGTENRREKTVAGSRGGYASDIEVVRGAQDQVVQQARGMLEKSENARERAALETALQQMARAQTALAAAKNSPAQLPAALAAQQAAYQALLKMVPREHRVSPSRNRGQSGSGGQQQQQLDQLQMKEEENRYETERQAKAAPTPQQKEQLQTADRLKELAQRQQDLNERLRELQTALTAAQNEKERGEIRRQLKRLRDEQREMLADVDELRQKLEQSPNANSLAEARKQLEQTRSDMQRAAQEMERQQASQALAAGTRAQQTMQQLREELRQQTSSQFSEKMRELRHDGRELAQQQEEIARGLDALENGKQKSLDNTAERKELAEKMAGQKSGLTHLLSGMRAVTEQAETTEPLLSRQLYDTLRRAEQSRTENLLDLGAQMTQRGFLPQAGEVERAARTNLLALRQNIERAAESVLGNETETLRYAQKELEDLTRQMEQEMGAAAGTNATATAQNKNGSAQNSTQQIARAGELPGTNSTARTNAPLEEKVSRAEQNNSPDGQPAEANATSNSERSPATRAATESSPGAGQANASPTSDASSRSPTAQNNFPEEQSGSSSGAREPAPQGSAGGTSERDRLRQLVQQLGRGQENRGGAGGPITGGNFANWSDRLRDVERVLDPVDLRNQLATVRERVSALRAEYRERGAAPSSRAVENQILAPLSQVRVWLQQELARKENSHSLLPLDRDPVPENYSELVRKYYEKLGSAQ